MSVYNNSIPNATDFLSDSQQDIRNNFQQLDTSFGLNHFLFSDTTASNGKHKYIEMVNEAALPAGLADEEGTIYTKKVSTESELFYTPDDTNNEYRMTRTDDDATIFSRFATNAGPVSSGWTFLPGGMLLQYGLTGTLSGNSTPTITFPKPFTNVPFSIQATMLRDVSNVDVVYIRQLPTNTNFQLRVNQVGNSRIYWMAVGV